MDETRIQPDPSLVNPPQRRWRDYCQCVGNCVMDIDNGDGTWSIRNGLDGPVVTTTEEELIEYIKGKAFDLGLTSK